MEYSKLKGRKYFCWLNQTTKYANYLNQYLPLFLFYKIRAANHKIWMQIGEKLERIYFAIGVFPHFYSGLGRPKLPPTAAVVFFVMRMRWHPPLNAESIHPLFSLHSIPHCCWAYSTAFYPFWPMLLASGNGQKGGIKSERGEKVKMLEEGNPSLLGWTNALGPIHPSILQFSLLSTGQQLVVNFSTLKVKKMDWTKLG